MMMNDDMALLREFAATQSGRVFETLVARHISLVHSAALRRTRDPHLAEEITQAVFIILARKAGSLGEKVILSGWLYRAAQFAADDALKMQRRRQHREQEAHMQSILENSGSQNETWNELSPLLDEAMLRLRQTDRDAVVLRYFENKSLREVGSALGLQERAAQKRIVRALEKLRTFFAKRGVTLSAAAIAGAVSAKSVQAAPVGLTKTITAVAMTKGVAASSSTLTLIKGALKIMAWTKMKTVVVISIGILIVAGTSTVTVKEIQEHRTYPWQINQGGLTENQVNQPPQVRILHSKFQEPNWAILNGKLIGLGVRVQNIVASAYGFITPATVIFSAKLPTGRYDYIACLPGGKEANEKALQTEVKNKFGVIGKIETRAADVWLLKVKYLNAPGLKRNDKDYGNALRTTPNGFHGWNESMSNLAYLLEDMANVPIIDQTGLTNRFDFDLNFKKTDLENHDWDYVNETLDQLGLELVSTNMPIEMLVVEKAM